MSRTGRHMPAAVWLSILLATFVCGRLMWGQTTPKERKILAALYESTDGPHWKNNDGWLGPAGTECNWHGVQCDSGIDGPTVHELDLFENGLTGKIPEALGDLSNLHSLSLFGNRLSGMLPDTL